MEATKAMQRADFKVVLDACVLANIALCDLLLKLAETPRLYTPCWTHRILDEVQHVQMQKLRWEPPLSNSWREMVDAHFPEALIDDDYQCFESLMENDTGDRHVLAAAVHAKAEVVATFNLKHFPIEPLAKWRIVAHHPANYLISLYSIDSGVVVSKLTSIAEKRKCSLSEVLGRLNPSVPMFTEYVANSLAIPIVFKPTTETR